MTIATHHLRAGTFALVVLAFFLPFATISCPGVEHTLSGLAVAVGTSVEEPQMFGPPTARRVDGEPLAALAFGIGLAAVAVAVIDPRWRRVALAALGALGAAALLVLKVRTEARVRDQGMGMLDIQFGVGYWLAVIGNVAGIVIALLTTGEATTARGHHGAHVHGEARHGRRND